MMLMNRPFIPISFSRKFITNSQSFRVFNLATNYHRNYSFPTQRPEFTEDSTLQGLEQADKSEEIDFSSAENFNLNPSFSKFDRIDRNSSDETFEKEIVSIEGTI